MHQVELAPGPALPSADRPIAVEDFAALRRRQPRPLLLAAEEQVAQRAAAPSAAAGVFVHGDLWQGNALWSGDTLAGLVDWDCAGAGAPGVDLGSLRCDAAICFGAEAADDIYRRLGGGGRPARRRGRLLGRGGRPQHPAGHGLVPGAIAGQGRPDLTRELLVRRRDDFLRAALDRLDAEAG